MFHYMSLNQKNKNNIYKMDDRALQSYRRSLCLRRQRRQKTLISIYGLCAAFCLIFIFSIYGHSVKTNASSGFKYYTEIAVKDGDNLWTLAENYIDYAHYSSKDQYISEICAINHLDTDCAIAAGQILIVPYYSDVYVW